jgi:hypothetical protein
MAVDEATHEVEAFGRPGAFIGPTVDLDLERIRATMVAVGSAESGASRHLAHPSCKDVRCDAQAARSPALPSFASHVAQVARSISLSIGFTAWSSQRASRA